MTAGSCWLRAFAALSIVWAAHAKDPQLTNADLFTLTNVWTVHLTFTPEQWKAIEPKQSGRDGMRFGPDGPMLLGQEGGRNGLSAARGIEFDYVKANLEFNGAKFTNIAVRYKGNGTFMASQNSLKHSFKLDLNQFVKGQKLAGVSKLNLHNNVTDATWMNETLSYQLYREAGVPAPRTSYAKVFVTVPGEYAREYFGLYSLVEDIDNHFAEKNFGTKKGAIFKPVTRELFNDLGTDWAKYQQSYDAKTELTAVQKQRVFDFARLVTKANNQEFDARVGEFLDLKEFARFMAVTVYLSTLDSILGMGQNFFVYLDPKSNKFEFLPWDLDNSFGQFPLAGTQEEREQLSILRPWQGENRFIERVFHVPAFQKLYRARLAEFSGTLFQPERFTNQVNTVAAAIRNAVKEESAEKLAKFDKAGAGESVTRERPGGNGMRGGGGGGGGFGPRGPGGGMTMKPIKAFVPVRSQSVADQLAGKSEGKIITPFRGPRGPRGGFDGPPPGGGFNRDFPPPDGPP